MKDLKKLKAENEELRDLIFEVSNFLFYGAMAGDYRLKKKYVKKIHKIASDEFEKRIKDDK